MPTSEYQILIDGVIVNKEYSRLHHNLMVKVFKQANKTFTTHTKSLI